MTDHEHRGEARWMTDFVRIVRAGRIVELGHILCEDIPNSPNHPPFMFRLTKLHNDARIGGTDVSASSDMFTMGSHNGTHIDALNHIACCGMVYPERDSDQVATRRDGYVEHGIETVEPLFMRGVLLDVAGLLGVESLAPAYVISPDALQQAAERQRVDELASAGVFEFIFCALPLRIKGGTGSPIRPIALF